MQITYSTRARKTLKKMPKPTAKQILDAMERIAEDPARRDLDIAKLQGRDGYRLRIGSWRVIYTNDGRVLEVTRIAPRGDAYK